MRSAPSLLLLSTLTWLAFVPLGCDELFEPQTCTDAGCVSETAVMLTRPGGAWADGDYTLQVRLDDQVHQCAFTLPIPGKLAHELRLGGEPFDCTPELPMRYQTLGAVLYPTPDEAQSCLATMDAGPQPPLASCPPLDGRYGIGIETSATPGELGLTLAFGDRVLFEQSVAVQYTKVEPNGPECGPLCYQARLEYRIPEPE
jgi:hypothetical protein